MNIMIMSHCGISVVIDVRLYDSQDMLKTGVRGTTSVYIEKATYQMNSVSGGQECRSLWLIE